MKTKIFRRLCCAVLALSILMLPGFAAEVQSDSEPEPVQLAAGIYGSACLYSDGTVTFDGPDVQTEDWGELQQIAISADGSFYGLSRDGRLHTDHAGMQELVGGWEDLVNFAVYSDRVDSFAAEHAVWEIAAAVDRSGRVLLAVSPEYTDDAEMPKLDVSGWSDIQSVAVGAAHVVGLRSNGTVAFTGSNDCGQGDVKKWKQVRALRAGTYCTVAICADGTVQAAGTAPDRDEGTQQARQLQISGWQDVADAAISDGNIYGLCADGTVLGFDWRSNGPYMGGESTIRENWKQIRMFAGGYSGLVGLRSDGIFTVAGGNQLYTPAPCRLAVGEVWPHWDMETGDRRSCFFCGRDYIAPGEDPETCLHFWQEYNYGDVNNRFYDVTCDFICVKCGQIRRPDYTNLTGLKKLRDSNESGSQKDVAYGTWMTQYGDSLEDSICFWVMHRSGYNDTEWVEIELNGEYEMLEFCTDVREGSEADTRMSYEIFADGQLLKHYDAESDFSAPVVSVKGVKILKIACTNSASAEGWGLLYGRLYRPFD